MDDEDRGQLWLRATGAANYMDLEHNKGYYQNLLNKDVDYPNPCFHQIELDLNRTFTELEVAESEQYIQPLRNILQTYVKRNPIVGYCQGMNFIVGRMLKYMSEEEAFWTLTMIIETMLPIDFYSNMVGALIDQ